MLLVTTERQVCDCKHGHRLNSSRGRLALIITPKFVLDTSDFLALALVSQH